MGSSPHVMPKMPQNGIIGAVKIKRFLRSSVDATAFRLGPRVFAIKDGVLLGLIADENPVTGGIYRLSFTKPSGPLRDSALEAFSRFKQRNGQEPGVEGPHR